MDCSYTKIVSYEIESKLQLNNLWVGDTVEHCLKTWCSEEELKDIRYLPLIVFGLIWKARNQCCFDDIQPKSYLVTSLCLGLLNAYPLDNRIVNLRMVVNEQIDKASP